MAKEKKIDSGVDLSGYNLPTVAKRAKVLSKYNPFIAGAKNVKITSKPTLTKASVLRKELKTAQNKVDLVFSETTEAIKTSKKTLNAVQKAVKKIVDGLKSPYKEAQGIIDKKILDFEIKEQERLNALERAEEKKARAAEKKGEPVKAPKKMVSRVEVEEAPQFVDHWIAEVTDFAKLPDEYKLVNEVLLHQEAKDQKAALNIPGVKAVNKKFLR